MTDAAGLDLHRALLATPLGQPGSGRTRYGAAMALHGAGEIGDAALEVYRICSARDVQDPATALRDAGLVVPYPGSPSPERMIRLLVDEVDRYLAALPGPGVAEVRGGLNAARGGPVRPPAALGAGQNAVLAAHFPQAVAALALTHPALAAALAAAVPLLTWITCDTCPPAEIAPDFAKGHACALIIGEDAPIAAKNYDLGLFLIAPHGLCRDHAHAAPELYAPLTGPHGWRFAPDAPLMIKPAHVPVWNEAFAPHLTKVGPVPFLCIFGRTRDAKARSRIVAATDWPSLAARHLLP